MKNTWKYMIRVSRQVYHDKYNFYHLAIILVQYLS